ncbi:alanine acetyltransferase [Stenotrophomonas mori]|uniref:Alanine acetyltransferase n=1 Tax=Stenotrophomonas mori TaxID=2871096 RepID=A0ABT0SJN2_9GAMM|nr:alanine acetyltransferase [Stenotrophomonas mori]MCL7715545.1 alanine acetyltransferase [Stenotrophomonas mori]
MGHAVYLEGGALAGPWPLAAARGTPARDVVVDAPEAAALDAGRPMRPEAVPPRRPPPAPEVMAQAAASTLPAARRGSGPRLPDRLQIALLRASGCNPSDPRTRELMDSWPLDALRASPAAKRALWPQLRALRRKQRQ